MSVRRIENVKLIALGAALGFWFVFYAWGTAKADTPAIAFSLAWLGLAAWQKLSRGPVFAPQSA
ncbi:hypothetical protein P7228_04600 [Altererythrobacter arenosus]|uniref:Uncharacterized protein n=1 Tax=Altererythrobacter arenosus TaxID=3032592 RepID=A0ABY8G1G6_9SPHN|nr:hypothetical protein [Altererythrobacter sp. CAU 1644]WFL78349.1 hypothetical protein P7228_04600 [Altererythrobacter sp. CAU 1644]